jgi:hypothetical protein
MVRIDLGPVRVVDLMQAEARVQRVVETIWSTVWLTDSLIYRGEVHRSDPAGLVTSGRVGS